MLSNTIISPRWGIFPDKAKIDQRYKTALTSIHWFPAMKEDHQVVRWK
ncbi:MAG: hypothetical protein ACTSP4_15605 [Candidatus Hodarchaeales archaeon]